MPLDHYVPQVHLKHFCHPDADGQLHAIRKSDLKCFPPKPKDVCRIEDGNTNAYLKNDRAIEEFLKGVEPKYNASLSKLRDHKMDRESIYSIAGFVAYVAPAAMRIHSEPFRKVVEDTGKILDQQGKIPKAPESLGNKSYSELIEDGTVQIEIDGKYPQSLGIESITCRTSLFGNAQWEVLKNEEIDSPFFTSDFPAAIEVGDDPLVVNRIVPLAPDLALRIVPDKNLARAQPDLGFPNFSCSYRTLNRKDILTLNRLIVRCAEDAVFYKDEHDYIFDFVAKNRHYHIGTITRSIPRGKGNVVWFSQRVVRS
jgi:hypothetical protein